MAPVTSDVPTRSPRVSAIGLVGVPSPARREEGTTEMLDSPIRHLTYR